jgi:Acyl-CoA synthetases (AMP-forming)/AMP-acid ligases II
MLSTILHLIEQIVKAPAQQAVRDVPFLSPADLKKVVEWNAQGQNHFTSSIYHPPHQPNSAIQFPQHLAIDAWDGKLTYAQLDKLTTDIAIELRQLGVGTDCLIPVCIEKSVWAVVAEISVLKANGAFVPMDPSQPPSWWKSTVQETRAQLVIASAKQKPALLSAEIGIPVLVLSIEAFPIPPLAQQQNKIPPMAAIPPVDPEATAYILFTSGSTAKPKGCVMQHQALADIVRHNNALHISPTSRVLQFASYTFAVSVIEIYCTLTAGGTVCIPSSDDRMNNLADYIDKTRVNWALMTPSTSNSLIGPSVVPTLKTLFMAGEPMTQRHVDIWAKDLCLHQCYGLSEWSGICAVTPQIPPCADLQHVGLISTTPNLWLVDPHNDQRLSPIGAIGELLIEGPSITRGYLNNPEKTAAAIIESPCWLKRSSQKPRHLHSTRMYKTGDLVQYLPDGSIRYVGRKGTQAKIRGKRVELSEVEDAAGSRCSSSNINRVVAEAVVPAGGDETSVLALFLHYKKDAHGAQKQDSGAMFVRTDNLLSDATNLRAHLPQALPDHMVPTVYIELAYVPLTITGKIDRRVLRSSANKLTRLQLEFFSSCEVAVEMVPPVNPSEIILHGLFCSVLGIDADIFGIHQSFLRLGGDSIKLCA